MAKGFLSLVAIMDRYSCQMPAWRLSIILDAVLCSGKLDESISCFGAPDIFNTNQGTQFTSESFVEVIKTAGIRISMDGKGQWVDNVVVEQLWRSLK
jgi:putative transposase